jgi:hypothetical protein
MTSPTFDCRDKDDVISRDRTESSLSDKNSSDARCASSNNCKSAAVNQTLAVKSSLLTNECVHMNRTTNGVAAKRLKLQTVDFFDKSRCLEMENKRAKIKENVMTKANMDLSSPSNLRRQHLDCSMMASCISKLATFLRKKERLMRETDFCLYLVTKRAGFIVKKCQTIFVRKFV